MRHKLFATALFLLASAFLTGSAFADTATLDFLGGTGPVVAGEPTYPYSFNVNGNPASLLCDAFDFRISAPESWIATVNTVTSAATLGLFHTDSDAATDYMEAGVIFDLALGINGNPLKAANPSLSSDPGQANWAIWALFSDAAYADIHSNASLADALAIFNAAEGVSTFQSSYFDGIKIYTPDPGTQVPEGDPTPQEFMGVPESSTLSLMGILLLTGVGGFTFRKRLALNLAVGQ